MRKHAIVLGLTFLALAAFSVFAGWTFFSGSRLNDGWRTLGPIWPYVLGAFAVLGAFGGLLFWLAYYSTRHRFEGEEADGN